MFIIGCAMITDPLGQKIVPNFREEAELIFRRQNTATSQVMILTLDEEDNTLVAAEQVMQDACVELNAYAIRLRDGLGENLLQQQQVFNSLDDCEAATRHLEVLLQSVSYD